MQTNKSIVFIFKLSFYISEKVALGGLSLAALACSNSAQALARYYALPLELHSAIGASNAVSFSYQALSARDCKKYLGRDTWFKKGYQQVQITLVNNTKRSVKFSPKNFDMLLLIVMWLLMQTLFSTGTRVAAWGIPGLFSWPLLIPAVIEAAESPKANTQLEKDFYSKCLREHIVAPGQTINRVIFVSKRQFKQAFSFSVFDIATNESFILSTQILLYQQRLNKKHNDLVYALKKRRLRNPEPSFDQLLFLLIGKFFSAT